MSSFRSDRIRPWASAGPSGPAAWCGRFARAIAIGSICVAVLGLACSDADAPHTRVGAACRGSSEPGCGVACDRVSDCAGSAGVGGTQALPLPNLGTAGSLILSDELGPVDAGEREPACVELAVEFERVTPTVVLLIDRSGSMSQRFDEERDRWQTLTDTLTDAHDGWLAKLASSVRFGMALYSSNGGFGWGDHRKQCPILEQVDIGLGNFDALAELLRSNLPRGDTPTAESLSRVAEQLAGFEGAGPKSIILATDGNPDTCDDPWANDDERSKALSVAAVAAAYARGIATQVISVGNEVTASHLKALAVAGAGGDRAAEAYTALDSAGLVAAFDEVIGHVRTCDFALQGVVQTDQASRGRVLLDGVELDFGSSDGWVLPDTSTVRLQGAACHALQQGANALSMRFPCDAIELGPR